MCGQRQCPGNKGGAETGPSPTNRGKPGTKHQVVTDQHGTPLVARLTGANCHDRVPFEDLLDAIPPIRRPSGQRRRRPATVHADKAYAIPRCRQALRRRHITVRIARKGVESSERLGRHRWVVEWTMAWLAQLRRLAVRYEQRADIHQAFLSLGCSLLCVNAKQRFC